jgi:hypothetical protein
MPHAMRKFTVLGAGDELTCCRYRERSTGLDSYKEPFTLSGYKFPDIHRGRLHPIPYRAALAKLSPKGISTDHRRARS